MFYGGIALGVVLMALSPTGTPANLTAYLFGSLLTTSSNDLYVFAALTAVVSLVTFVLRPRFFAVAQDEEYSRASGLPVAAYNIALSVLTAMTVVVSMRIIGLLLISALMILPNATGQLLGRSFAATSRWAVAIGVFSAIVGVTASFYGGTPSGATIVLVAIAAFLLASAVSTVSVRRARAAHAKAERHLHEHGPDCGHAAIAHGDHVGGPVDHGQLGGRHRRPEVDRVAAAEQVDQLVQLMPGPAAGAGGAAHLPGVIAAYTTLPVIGVPIKTSTLNGVDSLYSIVQMPKGIPVATVAINGGANAGLLAVEILALQDEALGRALHDYRVRMADEVLQKDSRLKKSGDRKSVV